MALQGARTGIPFGVDIPVGVPDAVPENPEEPREMQLATTVPVPDVLDSELVVQDAFMIEIKGQELHSTGYSSRVSSSWTSTWRRYVEIRRT